MGGARMRDVYLVASYECLTVGLFTDFQTGAVALHYLVNKIWFFYHNCRVLLYSLQGTSNNGSVFFCFTPV